MVEHTPTMDEVEEKIRKTHEGTAETVKFDWRSGEFTGKVVAEIRGRTYQYPAVRRADGVVVRASETDGSGTWVRTLLPFQVDFNTPAGPPRELPDGYHDL